MLWLRVLPKVQVSENVLYISESKKDKRLWEPWLNLSVYYEAIAFKYLVREQVKL